MPPDDSGGLAPCPDANADPADFDRLATRLEQRFRSNAQDRWADTDFEEWALVSFRLQYRACDPYRALCDARGVTPATATDWEDVPAVPATAFKYFDFSARASTPEAVFRTSGTTRGAATRGRHLVPRLDLYRASLFGPLKAALLPDRDSIRVVSLIPDPKDASDSSLSFMVGEAADRFASITDWLVGVDGAWRENAMDVLNEIRAAGEPVLVLGTALAFVHAVEHHAGVLAGLPEGSRIMETGGFKGARRNIPRADLYRAIACETGVPVERVVNEYGMTELLSQLWEPVLQEGAQASGVHVPAPWLRVRALHPTTLEPLAEGEEGILAFFDLANLGSVSHVLTEDVGSVEGGRVRLRGRASGAEPRGCSRAMDDLMAAQHAWFRG
jgi:acyl-protein synthetase LuxE